MPSFSVHFKGMLTKRQSERLAAAGVEIIDSRPSLKIGSIETGPPIYTARTEAASADEALAKVRETLEPETANFSDWEAGSAQT
jgi:hypothetical protein